ncbi:hypothetical protein HanRHA438_Chr16g0757461 [Helianthus annuus]|nr:hypothetical protein HanRHA438_Chr16g0757461 [Helianthus annuus]
MTKCKASIAIMKRNDAMRSPCLKPLCKSNSFDGNPFIKTDALLDFKHPFIRIIHRSGKFI